MALLGGLCASPLRSLRSAPLLRCSAAPLLCCGCCSAAALRCSAALRCCVAVLRCSVALYCCRGSVMSSSDCRTRLSASGHMVTVWPHSGCRKHGSTEWPVCVAAAVSPLRSAASLLRCSPRLLLCRGAALLCCAALLRCSAALHCSLRLLGRARCGKGSTKKGWRGRTDWLGLGGQGQQGEQSVELRFRKS